MTNPAKRLLSLLLGLILCLGLLPAVPAHAAGDADVNGDGVVNGKDLTRLRRYLAGYAVELY